jgi:hypothetical protein
MPHEAALYFGLTYEHPAGPFGLEQSQPRMVDLLCLAQPNGLQMRPSWRDIFLVLQDIANKSIVMDYEP